MAENLNLEIIPLDDGKIQVKWMDAQSGEFDVASYTMKWIAGGLAPLIGVIVAFNIGSVMPFIVGVIVFGFFFSIMGKASSTANQVTFGKDNTIHGGRGYPTKQISRFEYGLRSQLTGIQPPSNKNGQMAEPTIIRMWLDDRDAITISENNWQPQVNHKIQAALMEVLEAVRDADKQEEHAEKFGVVDGETGMPDY